MPLLEHRPLEIEAAVKRCVYANAEESYLLADHTKFGKKIS